MVGAALYFVSTFALAATRFRDRSGGARLAAAALAALAVPVLVVVLAARAGVPPSFPLVLAAHLGLWLVAGRGRGRADTIPVRAEDGDVLVPAVLAAAVALASALLGRDPGRDPLFDPWGHLAYSRSLVRSFDLYPPAFPALLATLTPFDPLGGAFRYSALVLHFALAAQFVALGGRADRGRAALAALAYLLVPAASRADPPRPELLGAVVLAASCGAALSRDLSPRARALTLGLLALLLLASHVSMLEIVLVPALGLVALAGERGARARFGILGAALAGAVVAFALSPFLVQLAIAPQRVTALAQQPGALVPIPLRSVASGLGLALAGVMAAALLRAAADWRAIGRGARAALVLLPAASVLLLAPIVLAAAGVHLPVKLFTERLLLAGALPLALAGAVGADDRDGAGRGGAAALALALAALVVAQVVLPVAPARQRLAAAVVAVAIAWLVARGGARWRVAGVAALVIAGAAVRLWIWTPVPPAAARWLSARPERLPVVSNWPVTNELDALLDVPVIDGLAGRDANIALHRGGGVSALHARLDWCSGAEDVERLASFLRARGDGAAWILVDPRFVLAWRLYDQAREQATLAGNLAHYPWLAAAPCTLDAGVRLARMDAVLRASPRVTSVFTAKEATVYRLDAAVGVDPPRAPDAGPGR